MTKNKTRVSFLTSYEVLLAIFSFLLFALILLLGGMEDLENRSLDLRFRLRGAREPDVKESILIIGISDADIQQIGPMPWDRKIWARLIDQFKTFGAKGAAFDILFNEKSKNSKSDEILGNSLKNFPTILPSVFVKKKVFNQNTYKFDEKTILERAHPLFFQGEKYSGFIDIEERNLGESDGVIRHFSMRKFYQKREIPSLDLALFRLGGRTFDFSRLYHSVNLNIFNCSIDGQWSFFQIHQSENLGINFRGQHGSKSFSFMPVHKVLEIQDVQQGKNIFQDRWILIGAGEIRGLRDIKTTPFGRMPGVEIHANVLDNLLNDRFIRRQVFFLVISLLFLMATAHGYLLFRSRSTLVNIYFFLFPFALLALGQWSLTHLNLHVPLVVFILITFFQWVITRFNQSYFLLRDQKARIELQYEELQVVHEVSQSVTFMDDLEKTLESILDKTINILNAERGSIMLMDEKSERLKVTTRRGEFKFEESGNGLAPGEGIAGNVFQKQKTVIYAKAHSEIISEEFVIKEDIHKDIHSLICIPLMVEGKSIGVLNIVNKKDRDTFYHEELNLALTLSNQASVLIQNARLYNLATVDGLTGLFVRRHFNFKLAEEISRSIRYDKPMAIMMSDIDHFKKFNDTYGHQTGDLVLREVAQLLKDSTRVLDTAARYGGEEFVVVLPETDEEGAFILAERYRKRIEEAIFRDGEKTMKVTVSIGVSTLPGCGATNEKQMVEKADLALYNCKHNGRNCVTVYKPELEEKDILKSS